MNMREIVPPTNCPSCDSALIWRKDTLYCVNPLCDAQSLKRIAHFAKTLKIKGLGEKSIEKLGITEPYEIYSLSEAYIADKLKSQKLAEKLSSEVKKSENSSLNVLLPAFSIPLVGKSASDKLCEKVSHIHEISFKTCEEAGLGPKVTQNLIYWLGTFIIEEWPFSFTASQQNKEFAANSEVVCITGKLSSYKSKAEAKQALEANGYRVKDSVTKEVTILVNESGIESAKIKKARANNIKIITNLKELLEN